MVARERAAASSGASNRLAACAARAMPLAPAWFVHSGEAHRMAVEGMRRGSYWEMSAQMWSALGWLALWTSTASAQ